LDPEIFLAVILGALLHADWNVIVKLNLDRFLAIFLLQCFTGLMGFAMVLSLGRKAQVYPMHLRPEPSMSATVCSWSGATEPAI
jgi:hypothetical protein